MLDLEIREAFHNKYSNYYGESARIIDELGVNRGVARIDLAVLNGSINGYEIKGSRDTLNRLPSQIESYNYVFDYLTIITSEVHLSNVKKLIPKWWGIQLAYNEEEEENIISFKELRKAKKNPKQDIRVLIELLWKEEAISLLERHDLHKGMKSKNRKDIWDKIRSEIDSSIIKDYTLNTLKTRVNWR